CKSLGLAQRGEYPSPVSETPKRKIQGKAQIDGLFTYGLTLGQMLQRLQRLLKGGYGLVMGRPCHRLLPRLLAVSDGLAPYLAPQGVVRQAFDILGYSVPDECLQGLDNASMEHPPSLVQQAPIGHLLGEGVLEGVDQLGKQARLVQELGVLEMRETQAEPLFRQLPHSLEEAQRDLRPHDRRGLQ